MYSLETVGMHGLIVLLKTVSAGTRQRPVGVGQIAYETRDTKTVGLRRLASNGRFGVVRERWETRCVFAAHQESSGITWRGPGRNQWSPNVGNPL